VRKNNKSYWNLFAELFPDAFSHPDFAAPEWDVAALISDEKRSRLFCVPFADIFYHLLHSRNTGNFITLASSPLSGGKLSENSEQPQDVGNPRFSAVKWCSVEGLY